MTLVTDRSRGGTASITKKIHFSNVDAKVKGIGDAEMIMESQSTGYVPMFLTFSPQMWMENVMLVETNKCLDVKMSFG